MSKIKTYEHEAILRSYSTLLQILDKINDTMKDAGITSLDALPPSVVSSKTLYEIAVCFDILYNTASEKELISDGHHKTHKQTH